MADNPHSYYRSVKKSVLIRILDLKTNTVNDWLNEGLPYDGDGRNKSYDVAKVVQWLIEKELNKKKNRPAKVGPEEDDMLQGGEAFDDNLDRYRAKKADLAELELEQKRGRLIERDTHDEIIMEAGDYVRSAMQAIPRGIATTLAKTHSPAEVESILESKITETLKRLSREP